MPRAGGPSKLPRDTMVCWASNQGAIAMPVHEWTRVNAGTFHDFHSAWIIHLKETLNGGLLPEGFYALAEQHAGRVITDVLTLQAGEPEPLGRPRTGPVAMAEVPPRATPKAVASPK